MPITKGLPENWHQTENLHLCTLLDFQELAIACGFKVASVTRIANGRAGGPYHQATGLLNWLSEEAVFVLDRA
jgi:hypothetical protein